MIHRRLLRRLLCCVALFVFSPGCNQKSAEKAEFFVFGTLVEVSLSGTNQETAQSAFAELQEMFQSMHRDWHAWEPGKLTALNHSIATGEVAKVDLHLATLIQQSQVFESASGGRFNPAIGKLVGLWGFHTSDYPIHAEIPASAEIDLLLANQPSSRQLQLLPLDNGQWEVRSSNPGVQLDFGGIAKGYAVDLAIQALGVRQLAGGVTGEMTGAIVNAGGDLRTSGSHQGRDWRVAVQNPLGGVIGVIETSAGEAVFTSGNYQRYGEDKSGLRYAHILDPRTGRPVSEVLSATVIAQSGIAADAAATALVVGGLSAWAEVAAGMNLDRFLLTDESGKVYLTRAMQSRLIMPEDTARNVVVLD
jgi:thiamine biosynthesis lipoprotein